MTDLEEYDGPLTTMRRPCTCAGPAPGYPQHEPFCGDSEDSDDADDVTLRTWQDTHDAPPEEG